MSLEEHYIEKHGRNISGYCSCCGAIRELDGSCQHKDECCQDRIMKIKWWMPPCYCYTAIMVVSLILMSYGVGCTPIEKKPAPPPPSVSGILVGVTMNREDSASQNILIEFEDGRIQKLRMYYSSTFQFKKGKLNIIEYDKSGTIKNVRVEE